MIFWGNMKLLETPVGSKSHKHVNLGSCSGHDFSIMVQPSLKRLTVLDSKKATFPLMRPIRQFCSLIPKLGLKWAYRRLRIVQMANFDFLINYYIYI